MLMKRYRFIFKGLVQGVGFRPFIYSFAKKYELTGFVKILVKAFWQSFREI